MISQYTRWSDKKTSWGQRGLDERKKTKQTQMSKLLKRQRAVSKNFKHTRVLKNDQLFKWDYSKNRRYLIYAHEFPALVY